MKRKTWIGVILASLSAVALEADAKSLAVRIDAQSLQSGTSERGTFYFVDLQVPAEISDKRLDAVLLEFYVDVAPDESIEDEYTPSIEVYPLAAPFQRGRTPVYSAAHPTSRPIALGTTQRVTVDVTDIVRSWITTPSTNHGLIIGSFGGPRIGDLDVRNDVLGGNTAIQATFFYQNRFGQRLSEEEQN